MIGAVVICRRQGLDVGPGKLMLGVMEESRISQRSIRIINGTSVMGGYRSAGSVICEAAVSLDRFHGLAREAAASTNRK